MIESWAKSPVTKGGSGLENQGGLEASATTPLTPLRNGGNQSATKPEEN